MTSFLGDDGKLVIWQTLCKLRKKRTTRRKYGSGRLRTGHNEQRDRLKA